MNSFKKLISILLSAMMVLSVCGGAFAETIPEREIYSGSCGAQGDNLDWTFYTINGVLSIKGTGEMADWFYGYYAPWYQYRSNIKTVLIYSGVTSIGDYAFYSCYALTSVTIPSKVERIGDSAFYGCTSLASATIGASVTTIGDFAFYDCGSLTSIEFPESVTGVGTAAFKDCGSLATASFLGAPPAAFGSSVFDGCAQDFIIYYTADHADEWAPNGETEWNGYPIACPYYGACGSGLTWTLNTVTGVLTISGTGEMDDYYDEPAPWSEYASIITSVVIEDGVTSIGYYAFADCEMLTSVSIPESVLHIRGGAFYNCRSLLSVDLPSGITEIDYDTFCFCLALEHVTIPEGVTYIGFQAFAECMSLDGLVLPSTLEIIDNRAFHDCSSLTSLYLPASLNYFGEQAFLGCFSLPGFEVDPDNPVFCSCEGVLFNKDMTELIFCPAGKAGDYVVPEGVQTIGTEAFYECSQITSITLPDGLLTISDYAFGGCYGLTSILIPDSVSSIGDYAFYACGNMRFIVFLGGLNFVYGWYIFEGCPADMLVCYTTEYEDTWNPEGTNTEWNGQPLSPAYLLTYTGEYSGSEYVPHGWGVTLPVCEQEGKHYTFTFNGQPWDGSEITGDLTVTVGIEPDVYTVIFVDGYDEEVIGYAEVMYGQAVVPPEAPEHYGYVFVGWDTELDFVTSDLVVTALYEVEYHTATFYMDGEVWCEIELAVGEEIVMPEYIPDPGTVFIGWECSDGQCYAYMPDHDVEFYGYTERIVYTVTIIYQYEDGTVIDEVTYNCYYGDAICDPCPEIEGYYCYPDPVCYYVTDDTVIYATYYPLPEYQLVIRYVDSVYYADGIIVEVAEPLYTTGYQGSEYTLVNPDVAGYTHESAYTSGWLLADTEIDVMYDPISYTLNIDYVFENGTEAAPTHTEELLCGRPYRVETPYIEGYTPDIELVEGDMPAGDVSVTVTYTANHYTLTIIYQYEDGTVISEETYDLTYGYGYCFNAPEIEGYYCFPDPVCGNITEDTLYVVTYYPLPEYQLVIHYVDSVYYQDGIIVEVADTLVTTGWQGSFYSLVNPDAEGYTHDLPYVSGWLYGDTEIYVMYDPISYTLNIDYVYENGDEAAPSFTEQLLYGRPYHVESPYVEGHTPDIDCVEGDMPAGGVSYTVVYSPNGFTLHIIYQYEDGTVIDEADYYFAYGEAYSIPSPVIEGYTADPEVVEGVLLMETCVFVTYYELPVYTLTMHFLDSVYFSEGTIYEIREPLVIEAHQGTPYNVELPEVFGYTSGITSSSGILNGDTKIFVMYTPNTYTLTVHFVYADGTEAFEDHVEEVLYGREYSVEVPTLPGYIPDPRTVAGTLTDGDTEIFVVYNVNTIAGDVNGDGVLSFNDISVLSMYLLGIGDIAEGSIPDFNGDGVVNYNDLTDMYLALLG